MLEDKLGEDARVTILGHVQRGGRPSAYDRWASTWLGYHAVHEVLSTTPEAEGRVIGTGPTAYIASPWSRPSLTRSRCPVSLRRAVTTRPCG
ncbi:6-phosphofructokinase [Cutibacterium acnes JCM 18916]|nr:6-phosphofructokinase [Cutibacterium acnes JCM 18916]